MTTADEVLNQIDAAIADHTVSADAMRSTPNPEPAAGPRLWIAPADTSPDETGWQEVGFITDADFTIEGPAVDPELEQRWREVQEYMRRVEAERVRRAGELLVVPTRALQALKLAVEQAARNAAKAIQALQQAGVCDDHGKPVRARDRPAWQSPYGPAKRRRR
jgi:hypothetical protein